MIRIGTAGWSLPTEWQDRFPEGETHLHSYAQVLGAVEINRTFKKMPRASTFERWRDRVPEDFRFSVKLTREVTHDARLQGIDDQLEGFLDSVGALGGKLGPLLIQLPPSLGYDAEAASTFLETLRELREGPDVLEPRHESWFTGEVDDLLAEHRVARVAADPPRAEADGRPGGYEDLAYFRLHGQPRTYYSAYREAEAEEGVPTLEEWAGRVREASRGADEAWCIFDNTARGEGTGDALAFREMLGEGQSPGAS